MKTTPKPYEPWANANFVEHVAYRCWPRTKFAVSVRGRAAKAGVPAWVVTDDKLTKAYDGMLSVDETVRRLKGDEPF